MFAGEKLNILNETDAIQRQRCDFRSFGEPQCFWCDVWGELSELTPNTKCKILAHYSFHGHE